MNAALEMERVGKHFRGRWALRDCSLRLPHGRIAALIGANGAGKSTLLNIAVGLSAPTTGDVRVGGARVQRGSTHILGQVGFVAQDMPLYGSFTAEELLRAGRGLNPRFDESLARTRWRELGIPLDQKVGTMSGGQRAQVALALALAKRPSLLLLDEPLASLDPLARRELLQTLMAAVAEAETTVLLSSHLLAELERVCDWVVVLGGGRVQLAGDVEELVASHWWVRLPRGSARADWTVIDARPGSRESLMLVRAPSRPVAVNAAPASLEDVVLCHLARPEVTTLPTLEAAS